MKVMHASSIYDINRGTPSDFSNLAIKTAHILVKKFYLSYSCLPPRTNSRE